ncbi:MAG: divalent-cation tolerance protein CutA [Candidatus Methanomethyliaceae archaeon]|nr:divalent-cation tolerance protein CutA [Candidatus Methanomethyliaceae archaeon]
MIHGMYAVVFITVGSKEEAKRIAHELVDKGLAACVNIIGGVESVFYWEDKINTAHECLLIVKTTKEKLDLLVKRVKELHSYSVPEIIWVTLDGGFEGYLDWVKKSIERA